MAELTAGQRVAARAARARRGELGLTQKQLADKAGVHRRTIQDFEREMLWPHATTLAQIERLGLDWYAGKLSDLAAAEDSDTVDTERAVSLELETLREMRRQLDVAIQRLESRHP